jgi:ankyrin repeat protein
MLDAGGNPNALNSYGWPLVFMRFKLGYYQEEELTRLDLLLDRGADINAVVPEKNSESAGYTLVLYTTQNGWHVPLEYMYAQHLLERGADPNRVAPDGMTLAKVLTQHRDQFAAEKRTPPQLFTSLWAWAEAHGIFAPPQ